MHVGVLCLYDPSCAPGNGVSPGDIYAHIEARLDVSPVLRQRLLRVPMGMDHPYWVDDSVFDLSDHISHMRLPEPGDWRALCGLVGRLLGRPLDLANPAWELTVIEGLEHLEGAPEGAFALFWKIHHSAADTAGVMDLIERLHTPEALTATVHPQPWSPDPSPDLQALLDSARVRAQALPMKSLDFVRRMAPRIGETVKAVGTDAIQARLKAPKTVFQATVSGKRTFTAQIFSLDAVARVQHAVRGATFTDVFLTIIGGALRSYLAERSALPDEGLQTALPISLRTPADRGTPGNLLTVTLVGLGTDIEDPLERLVAINRSNYEARCFMAGIGAAECGDILDLVPPPTLSMAAKATSDFGVTGHISNAVNTIVSTVRGSRHALYCAGARCDMSFVAMPVPNGVGLVHSVNTYGAAITISATACRELLSDPERYAACLAESFASLEAALNRSGTGPAVDDLSAAFDDDWRDLKMVDFPLGNDVEKLLDRMQASMESMKDTLRRSSAAFDQNQRKMSNLVLAQAEENLRANFDAMRTIMVSKDPQTAMRAQGEAVRAAFERSLGQVRELSQMVEAAQDSVAVDMGLFSPSLRSASDFFAQLRNANSRVVPDDISGQIERYLDSMQDAMNEMRESMRDVRGNLDVSQQQMMSLVLTHARENLDTTYEAMNRILGSKDPMDAMRVQAAAVQDAIERGVNQVRQVNALLSDNGQAAFEPIRDFYAQLGNSSDFFSRLNNTAGGFGFPASGSFGSFGSGAPTTPMGAVNPAEVQKMMDSMQSNMRDLQTALQKSGASMTESQREIAELLMNHARENLEESMRALQGVAQSGDLADSLRLQGSALRDSMQRNMRQIREVTEKVNAVSQDAMKPLGDFFEQLRQASEAFARLSPFDRNDK